MTVRLSTGIVNSMLLDKSFKEAIEGASGFLIDVYTGSRPATPNDPATGTLLLTISNNGAGTGLHLASSSSSGSIAKEGTETWSGTGVGNGTAGYYRMRLTTDAGNTTSTTLARVDGTIATSGADMNMSNTSIVIGAPHTINSATFTLPVA